MVKQVINFTKEAKIRYKSETPTFWNNMKPIMGSVFGGLSAIQAAIPDTAPQWIKWSIVFVVGAAGYFVGNFGTKNPRLLN